MELESKLGKGGYIGDSTAEYERDNSEGYYGVLNYSVYIYTHVYLHYSLYRYSKILQYAF